MIWVVGTCGLARPIPRWSEAGTAYERADYRCRLQGVVSAPRSAGDPEALYRLGLLYARGQGVLANLADAAVWYRRAAEQGHAEAQHQLSLLHLDGYRAQAIDGPSRDGTERLPSATPTAADDNRKLLFPNGLDVPQDPAEALRWSRAAAEQGIADAQANTGLIYARGIGCERDYREARRWYQLAAEQGSAAAELGLGILYANGHGVEKDLATAAGWYEKAAEKGNAAAQVALGLMYLSGQGVERDADKAAAWFGKAAEQGNARAQYNLALLTLEARRPAAQRARRRNACCVRPRGKGSSRRCCASRSCTRPARPRCRT